MHHAASDPRDVIDVVHCWFSIISKIDVLESIKHSIFIEGSEAAHCKKYLRFILVVEVDGYLAIIVFNGVQSICFPRRSTKLPCFGEIYYIHNL